MNNNIVIVTILLLFTEVAVASGGCFPSCEFSRYWNSEMIELKNYDF